MKCPELRFWLQLLIPPPLAAVSYVIYVYASITLNGGHPWPYAAWCFFGLIPLTLLVFWEIAVYCLWLWLKRRG